MFLGDVGAACTDCTLRTAALITMLQHEHYTWDLNQFLFALSGYGRETRKLMWVFFMKNIY